jgi:hypothetical protein
MNASCPQCGAVYAISPQHVGRQLTCRKCSSTLVVAADGLHLVGVPEAALVDEIAEAVNEEASPPEPRKRSRGQSPFGALTNAFGKGIDIPTVLFGGGAFLVIVFMFFPLIDQAKVNRRQAALTEGERRERRREREFNEKKDKNDKDEDLRKKQREAWEKERKTLQDDIDDTQTAVLRAPYWYRWGMMFGFMLLAAASLGYLSPTQPLIRRITGCIIIVAEVVLIFIVFVGKSGISN